ncbi:uncharacterized protein P884DRAFT_260782 [Thermothelomyces heterothallicus CBS 202.75]|uniref:uncharacterized protein n=1 Tax=Thermothelomyces heterothallicus CBS 202.75 TaxID=1149848 RepID=UPI0037443D70
MILKPRPSASPPLRLRTRPQVERYIHRRTAIPALPSRSAKLCRSRTGRPDRHGGAPLEMAERTARERNRIRKASGLASSTCLILTSAGGRKRERPRPHIPSALPSFFPPRPGFYPGKAEAPLSRWGGGAVWAGCFRLI